MATTEAPYGFWATNPTKKLAYWVYLLGQPLSRNRVFQNFSGEPPPPPPPPPLTHYSKTTTNKKNTRASYDCDSVASVVYTSCKSLGTRGRICSTYHVLRACFQFPLCYCHVDPWNSTGKSQNCATDETAVSTGGPENCVMIETAVSTGAPQN